MDWSNEKVLELIELIRQEPAIWNRKENSNQNRQVTIEAWERIQSKFSSQCPIDELKRKRNCLMTAYRDYTRKIKQSSATSLSSEDLYRPTWFAFNAINSFLGPKYGLDIIKSEEQPSNREIRERWPSRDSDINGQSLQTESETSQHSVYLQEYSRKRRISPELQTLPKKQMHENLVLYKEIPSDEEKSKVNEYDLYGQLLAEKLKKMDEEGRLIVMNEIDNLVFKHAVTARSRVKQQSVDSTAYIAPSHHNYLKASGSGTNKKKITMFTQQVSSQHHESNSSSDDD